MLVHQELTDRILRACYIVHRELGCGFLEKVYQEAVAITLQEMCIPFEREKHLPIIYHGIQLKCDYIADFIVAGEVVLELKATPNHPFNIRLNSDDPCAPWIIQGVLRGSFRLPSVDKKQI